MTDYDKQFLFKAIALGMVQGHIVAGLVLVVVGWAIEDILAMCIGTAIFALFFVIWSWKLGFVFKLSYEPTTESDTHEPQA